MFSKTNIALSVAIVLSAAVSASAATKPRLLYNVVPDLSAPSGSSVRDYITDPIIAPEPPNVGRRGDNQASRYTSYSAGAY